LWNVCIYSSIFLRLVRDATARDNHFDKCWYGNNENVYRICLRLNVLFITTLSLSPPQTNKWLNSTTCINYQVHSFHNKHVNNHVNAEPTTSMLWCVTSQAINIQITCTCLFIKIQIKMIKILKLHQYWLVWNYG
jgi:hypothetical protein